MLRRDADGFATVGDLAERDAPTAACAILGRGDAAITTAGATVLAEHVESRLAALPGVDAAAVLGEPHELLGQRVLAVVELADGVELERVVDGGPCRALAGRAPPALVRARPCRAPTRARSPAACCATRSPSGGLGDGHPAAFERSTS